jgi:GDP-L-fucose synthase
VTIRELAEMVMSAIGYSGTVTLDPSKPDGTPRKLLDVSRLRGLGWQPKITLTKGIESTYTWFKQHADEARL